MKWSKRQNSNPVLTESWGSVLHHPACGWFWGAAFIPSSSGFLLRCMPFLKWDRLILFWPYKMETSSTAHQTQNDKGVYEIIPSIPRLYLYQETNSGQLLSISFCWIREIASLLWYMITRLEPQVVGQPARSLFVSRLLSHIWHVTRSSDIFRERGRERWWAEPAQRSRLTTLSQKPERIFAAE